MHITTLHIDLRLRPAFLIIIIHLYSYIYIYIFFILFGEKKYRWNINKCSSNFGFEAPVLRFTIGSGLEGNWEGGGGGLSHQYSPSDICQRRVFLKTKLIHFLIFFSEDNSTKYIQRKERKGLTSKHSPRNPKPVEGWSNRADHWRRVFNYEHMARQSIIDIMSVCTSIFILSLSLSLAARVVVKVKERKLFFVNNWRDFGIF